MHPLMQAFTREQLAQLQGETGAKASTAPILADGITRRALLGSGAGLVVWVGWPGRADAAQPGAEGAATGPLAPNAFVRVGNDNLVTVVCKHHEMGQGNTTGLASMVADELDADWKLVRTEYAPSNAKLYNNLAFGEMQGTGGSSAIANSFMQMRTAGATARAMLVAAAADAWKVPASEIRTSQSVLTHASGKRATYGEMAAAASRQAGAGTAHPKDSGAIRLHRLATGRRCGSTRHRSATAGGVHHRLQVARHAHRGDRVAAVVRRQAGVVRCRARRRR